MFRKIKFLFLALCAVLCFSLATACTSLSPTGSSSSSSYSESVEGGSSSDEKTESGENSGESSGESSSDSTEGTKPEESICKHTWDEGYCPLCQTYCSHDYQNEYCTICGQQCWHMGTWENGVCTNCHFVCLHQNDYTNGVCKDCGVACTHENYTNGTCNECSAVCPHTSYTSGVCDTCKYVCPHEFDDGVCKDCGLEFSLTYLLATSGDYYTVTGANDNTVAAITIPAIYENKPVKKIASEAFKNYANLTTVTLSEGLEEIGAQAFYGCSKLSSCNIPSTVTNIGKDIMENVPALTYENNVCYLGAWVIGYDDRVTDPITVKAGTVGIAESAFADGGQVAKLSAVSLPTSLKYIGKNAFYNCSALEEIDIPNEVKKIQPWTFAGCSSLASVTLSSTLSAIYPYAFENCVSLTEIDIPQTVSLVDKTSFNGTNVIQTVNNVNYVDTWAIGATSKNVTSLAFRQGTLGIAQNAFQDYANLASVNFSGIEHIGYMAFAYCSELTEITLPDSVLTVGAYAFNNCNKATTVSIGNGVTRIEESAFAKTGSVSIKLSIGKNIEYLGDMAFYSNVIQPIEFNGTAEDWLAIEKVSGWCNFFQVHCLEDGKYLNSSGVEIPSTNN